MRARFDSKSLRKFWRRISYFVSNFLIYLCPLPLWRMWFRFRMRGLTADERSEAERRARHYCRLHEGTKLYRNAAVLTETEGGRGGVVRVREFRFPWRQKPRHTAYFFDLYRYVRIFPGDYRFAYLFDDARKQCELPTLVKTRHITQDETNSVIFKLNSVRHFAFVDDRKAFHDKEFKIVFRNVVRRQPWRTRLLEKYINHPLCDFGQVNADKEGRHSEFVKPFMTMQEQMNYKFVCTIEGNDVATNLKWVMSSNTIAVMPRPTVESWFMEHELVADYHYICIKDDYSDLIEKTTYYAEHPLEAEQIIAHAHDFVRRFQNKRLEDYTCYLVLKKYFDAVNHED